jgi:sugar phosphate isomerase/epimerase
MMPIGYGTYGLRDIDPATAVRRLATIGYEALEITAAEGWPTAPARLDGAQRRELGAAIRNAGLPPPVVMALLPLCVEGPARPSMVAEFGAICALARDIAGVGASAIVTSTLGGERSPWESDRERITDRLIELAGIAEGYGVSLAVEPHVGGTLDTPEKAVELMRMTGHPRLKLNFDVSHFHVQGIELAHCVDLCLPHAIHVHIKDGYTNPDGRVVFQLPGEGSLDLDRYMALLEERGNRIPVVVEVSGMIWKRPEYDPWEAAERSFEALDAARRSVGA